MRARSSVKERVKERVKGKGKGKGKGNKKLKQIHLLQVEPKLLDSISSLQSALEEHILIGLSREEFETRRTLYEENTLSAPRPTVMDHLKSRFLAPFPIIQLASNFLSVLEERQLQPCVRIVTTVGYEALSVIRDSRAIKALESGSEKGKDSDNEDNEGQVRVLRSGHWDWQTIESLVPGDVISLGLGKVPADCLLVKNAAVVSEATQTGESAPQFKEPMHGCSLKGEMHAPLDEKSNAHHILLSGTDVLQTYAKGVMREEEISLV